MTITNDRDIPLYIKEYYQSKKSLANEKMNVNRDFIYSSYPILAELEKSINITMLQRVRALAEGKVSEALEKLNEVEVLRSKRKAFISEHEITDNFSEPQYECIACNDTGYIKNSDGKISKCSCLLNLEHTLYANITGLNPNDSYSLDTINLSLYPDSVSEKADSAGEKALNFKRSPRENAENIIRISRDFIDNISSAASKNLLFTGPTGTGKTFISKCIGHEVQSKGINVMYRSAPELFDLIIDYKNRRYTNNPADSTKYDMVFSVPLLIIDDLGTESATAAKFTELIHILDSRSSGIGKFPKKTLISTNLSPKDLYRFYDERIISRLLGDSFLLCFFAGDDIRISRKLKKL